MNSICAHLNSMETTSIRDAILKGYEEDELFANCRFLSHFQQSPQGLWLKKSGDKRVIVVPNIRPIREKIIFEHHSTSGRPFGQS